MFSFLEKNIDNFLYKKIDPEKQKRWIDRYKDAPNLIRSQVTTPLNKPPQFGFLFPGLDRLENIFFELSRSEISTC